MKLRVDNDSKLNPDLQSCKPHHSTLFIDDATGFVSGSGPASEVVDGAPVALGQNFGMTQAISTGSITVVRPGTYRLSLHVGSLLGANSSIVAVSIFKNAAAIATATGFLGGALIANLTSPSTAVVETVDISGIRRLALGDVLTVVCTSNTGTVTIKNMSFDVEQLTDDAASSAA